MKEPLNFLWLFFRLLIVINYLKAPGTRISARSDKKNSKKNQSRNAGDANTYVVEKICDQRNNNGVTEYYIKWLNYPETQCTWESEDQLQCSELLADFHAKRKTNTQKHLQSGMFSSLRQ